MASTLNVAFGAFCVVLGILWTLRPVTMSRLQQRFVFLGAGGDEVEINETLGRIGGVALTAGGVYLLATA